MAPRPSFGGDAYAANQAAQSAGGWLPTQYTNPQAGSNQIYTPAVPSQRGNSNGIDFANNPQALMALLAILLGGGNISNQVAQYQRPPVLSNARNSAFNRSTYYPNTEPRLY
jgi:hypothetical protein